MKKLILYALATLGAITLFFFLFSMTMVSRLVKVPTLPSSMVLEIDFERGLVERFVDNPFAPPQQRQALVVQDLVEALGRAAEDERVRAVVARVGQGSMGLAQLQEVRGALKAFRESGKKAVAFVQTFSEVGSGFGPYYLATAFDRIYLQPSGELGFAGLRAEVPFLRGTFDLLDLKPQLDHRKEYKTMKDIFTDRAMSEPHRESIQSLLQDIYSQVSTQVAEDRSLDLTTLNELTHRGSFSAQQAVELGLVDGLAYRDEVYDQLKEELGDKINFVYISRYIGVHRHKLQRGKVRGMGKEAQFALIHGLGDIVRSDGGGGFYSEMLGADGISRALREALQDDHIRAVILRVDSGGGSYVASDTIYREVLRLQEKGKPVVVSMGNVAASGGYFLALGANQVVAQPGTITGSIGVVAGKFVTSGLWQKLGVRFEAVDTHDNSSMWSTVSEYTPEQWQKLQTSLDRIYEDFTSKVAERRGLSPEQVEAAAKGRVWTGVQAKSLGLVDALGGVETAVQIARTLAEIPEDQGVRLQEYPPRKSFGEALLDMLKGEQEMKGGGSIGSGPLAALGALAHWAESTRPFWKWAEVLSREASPQKNRLRMNDYGDWEL